jgi:hypothetical protein
VVRRTLSNGREIWIESAAGAGTTIFLHDSLPLSDPNSIEGGHTMRSRKPS